MENRPILEKLAWIAGILSFLIAIGSSSKPGDLPAPAPALAPALTLAPVPTISMPVVGSCTLDAPTTDGLKKNGLYDEVLHLCGSGKASTVGQSIRIPSIHPDSRFQYINPVEFNNDHGLSDSRITNALYQIVSDKLSMCFSSSFSKGASPHERLDLEIDCLQESGLKAQDKVFYMLVENARAEGRNGLG